MILIDMMKKYDVPNLVYSSSAGVYEPKDQLIDEGDAIAYNNPYANSGIVMTINPEKLSKNHKTDPFVGLKFQQQIEKDCWEKAGKNQQVPAQRLLDFMQDKKSKGE